MKSSAYWDGYIAVQTNKPRECPDPWNAQWMIEWLAGYDDARVVARTLAIGRISFGVGLLERSGENGDMDWLTPDQARRFRRSTTTLRRLFDEVAREYHDAPTRA